MGIRRIFMASMLSVTATAVATGSAMAAPKNPVQLIPDQYICVFKSSVPRGHVQTEANRAVTARGGRLTHVYRYSIRGFAVRAQGQSLARLKAASSAISYCEQDQVATVIAPPPGKGPGGGDGGGTAPAEVTPWGITRVCGSSCATDPVSPYVAWVIDTGIDLNHPDLNVNLSASKSFIRDTSPDDGNGHGTHVAGTIGAVKGNGIGVIGVAPGVQLAAVRVLDRNGRGSYSDVIRGVDYVAQFGQSGDVANMSLGGGASDALDSAVLAASANVKFAIAAGNSSDDAGKYSPARVNGPNIYTISAFAQGDSFASFSNYGNPPIDYSEPGVSIYSTYKDGGYATLSGTSMAAPHMAGILLLGSVESGGTVSGDKDSTPDTIGVR
jgi:hypothetical protein